MFNKNSDKFIIFWVLIVAIIVSLVKLYAATGTPSNLVVRTDANNGLLVTAVTQTNPVTQGVFSSRTLRTDSSGSLQVILTGTVTPTYPLSIPASTCAAPSLGLSGNPDNGIAFTATPSILNCIEAAIVTTLTGSLYTVAVDTRINGGLGVNTAETDDGDITASGTITGNIVNAISQLQLNGTNINTGGTLTNVAYLDAANIFTNTQTITRGSISSDLKVFDSSVTWNNGAVAFTGWKFNVTNTASAAGSLLFDWQIAGVSQFNIGLTSVITRLPIILSTGGTPRALIKDVGAGEAAIRTNTDGGYANWYANALILNGDADLVAVATGLIGVASGDAFGLTSRAWIRTAPSSPVACTSPSVLVSNGTASFTIDVGSSCTGITTLVVTMPAVTTRYNCKPTNLTNPATSEPDMTASTTTSITITNFVRTTGVAGDWTAGDDIAISCTGH